MYVKYLFFATYFMIKAISQFISDLGQTDATNQPQGTQGASHHQYPTIPPPMVPRQSNQGGGITSRSYCLPPVHHMGLEVCAPLLEVAVGSTGLGVMAPKRAVPPYEGRHGEHHRRPGQLGLMSATGGNS